MTPEQRIDANIRAVLQAWASDGDKTTAQENMREEMRRIMAESVSEAMRPVHAHQADMHQQIIRLQQELARYRERERTMGWNQS